jgi:tetratricopeptide (TPR) repeat protein
LRLAQALDRNHQSQPAAIEYKKAQELDPKLAGVNAELGALLARQGQFAEALPYFSAAVAEDRSPENLAALANALLKLGRAAEAFDLLNEAVSENPRLAEAQFNLSLLLAGSNRRSEAIDHLQLAIAADPSFAPAQNTLAALLAADGKLADALVHFQKAVDLDPKNLLARANLGRTLSRLGQHAAAIKQLRAARELDPQQPQVASWLAWSLATAPDATLRNGSEAQKLAEKAVAATQSRDAGALDALAAAQAELGQFTAAEHSAQQARQLALSLGNQPLAAEIGQRVDLYRAKKAYRR